MMAPVALDRSERRRLDSSRRRRRRALLRWAVGAIGLAAAALGAIAAIAAIGGNGPGKQQAARTATRPPGAARIVLHPPGPIPGYLLIADRGNDRMLLVDSAHHIYWRYPGGRAIAMPFRFGDDTFFGPRLDRIISNQEDQHTIQIISFPGRRILWRYGHVERARAAAPGLPQHARRRLPAAVNRVTVADAYNCRVLFISLAHRIVRQYGTTGVCRHDPPRYLGAVNGATPLADGGTLVSEITGSWIDDIGPTGKPAVGRPGAGLVPVRPAAPRPEPDPARRLHEPRCGDHHDPHRPRALELRPGGRRRRPQPSVTRDA